ncbi:translocation/assembly module TamB domain-containing protein [Pollutibacter soli]|uniref:translocation/assembly module TamB domain-containing protein n=1 Tax=Pollutibacter soli TaxID=3034157 RepID=UPI00301331DA
MGRFSGSIVKKVITWTLGVIGSVLLLILILMLLLQTPWGQNIVRVQAVKYLEKKLQTKVEIAKVRIRWLTHFHAEGIFLEDQQQRKLLHIGQLDVSYSLIDLFASKLSIPDININKIEIQLLRSAKDSVFNFHFIPLAFAGSPEAAKTKVSKPFIIDPGKITISGLKFLMDDRYGGSLYNASWNNLSTEIHDFNPDSLHFKVSYLLTDSIDCKINLHAGTNVKNEPVEEDTGASHLRIEADSFQLSNTVFLLENTQTKMKISSIAALLGGSNIRYDQSAFDIKAKFLTLQQHKTEVELQTKKSSEEKTSKTNSRYTDKPFTWEAEQLFLDNNQVVFNDDAHPKMKRNDVDFRHLDISHLAMTASNAKYDGLKYEADIHQLQFREKSGFELLRLQTSVRYSDTGVSLQNLHAETNENLVRGHITVKYNSTADITAYPQFTTIDAELSDTRIRLRELLYFSPSLANNKSFRPLTNKTFFINTTVHGTLNNLKIPTLSVKENKTSFVASAEVLHLPDTKKMIINLQLKSFSSTRADLLSFLPPNAIPDSLLHYIPATFSVNGTYKGTMKNMYTNLYLKTSSGNLAFKGTLQNISDKTKAVYDMAVSAGSLQLGKILRDSSFGNATATVKIKGRGLDLHKAAAKVFATVDSFTYKGYTYSAIQLTGSLENELLEAHVTSKDPEMQLTADTWYSLEKNHGKIKTDTKIEYLNLYKLRLYDDTLIIKGTNIVADIPQFDSAAINGQALVTTINIQYKDQHISLDTILLDAKYDSLQHMNLHMPVGDISVVGKYALSAIVPATKTILNRYFYTQSVDTAFTKSLTADIRADIDIPDSLGFLVPGFKSMSPLSLRAKVNTDSSIVEINASIAKLVFGDYDIDSLKILALNKIDRDQTRTLAYELSVGRVDGPTIKLFPSSLKGTARQGIVDGVVSLYDDNKDPRYILPFHIVNDPNLPFLQLRDSLVIDRKNWSVNKDNLIYFSKNALKGSNLRLSRNDEMISILSDSSDITGLPLTFSLKNFKIEHIIHILTRDTALIAGNANGEILIHNLGPFVATGNLQIDELKLKEVNTGTLTVHVTEASEEQLVAAAELKGDNNQVVLDGKFNPQTGDIAAHLDMKKFDLRNAEMFTEKWLGMLQGTLKGNIDFGGTLKEPKINGNIHADSIKTIYREYGTELNIPVADFVVDGEGIKFKEIVFTDSSGNKGRITGNFSTSNFINYAYNANITTNNFLVIGPRRYPNQTIYGPTSANANINIKGTEKMMDLGGSVTVAEKSQFTYVYIPQDKISRGDGLIEFFDPNAKPDSAAELALLKQIQQKMEISMNVYVTVTPSSTVTIVLDELSGDHLKIAGTAGLNYTMRPGGEMSLVGNYTVESGDYDLSIASVIRKKFSIEKGSTITWNGDPLKGNMNITALYTTKTTARELVQDIQSVPGIDKQQFNIQVYLILTKELLNPDIQFRLDMAENEQNAFDGIVYSRLKQVNTIPSELNKQVMGLLAINHFIADNPFNSLTAGGGPSFETQAFTTAGRLLTDQLNQLLGKAIKGVDINFELDVNEDYTSGQAQRNTNLKIGLTQSLANNRLSVYVGNFFALEGQNQYENVLSGLAGDIKLEYLLSRDGRYRIKGYRLTENELTFQGSIIKTGVTFEIVLEFNKLKNAFRKRGRRTQTAAPAP